MPSRGARREDAADGLTRELTGLFVGCDDHPSRATCSVHDRPRTLAAGDRIQLEVERVMDEWTPLFHRCVDHAVALFPGRHTLRGTEQALVTGRLVPTGCHLPESREYAPEALTLAEIELIDISAVDQGRQSPLP